MPARGSGRKNTKPKAEPKVSKEKDELIGSLKGKIAQLESYNKSLSIENMEQGKRIAELTDKLESALPAGELVELTAIEPDDMIKVRIVRAKYSLSMTDALGQPHNYTTGDEFEIRESMLYTYPSGAIVPLKDLVE